MSEDSSTSGIGFCGLLTIVFVTLKLLDKIDWSWWWVLGPLWMPITVVLAVLAILGAITVIATIFDNYIR